MAQLGHTLEVVAPYDPEVVPANDPEAVPVHRFRYIWPRTFSIMGHARAMESDMRLRPLALLVLPFFLAAGFFGLLRVTGRQKSQVIHVHWAVPNGLMAAWVAAVRRIPFVVSLHGTDIFLARRNRLFARVTHWVFKRAAAVTACSPELRDGALALGAREVRMVPWGADPTLFHPDRRSRAYREAAGWSDECVVFAALGRLVHKKGFDRLIQAWAGLANRHQHARLVIGGDGPLRQALEAQVRNLGLQETISLPGQIPWNEVPEFLASSDIFVLPSVRDPQGNVDGLPTVLPEAMACGLPAVASRLGGIPMVIENHVNGLLVAPDDVTALEGALSALMEPDLRSDLARAARFSVESRFNWTAAAQTIAEMMADTVNQRQVCL